MRLPPRQDSGSYAGRHRAQRGARGLEHGHDRIVRLEPAEADLAALEVGLRLGVLPFEQERPGVLTAHGRFPPSPRGALSTPGGPEAEPPWRRPPRCGAYARSAR